MKFRVLSPLVGVCLLLAAAPASRAQIADRGAFGVIPVAEEAHDEHPAGCTIIETSPDGRALADGTPWPNGIVYYTFAQDVDQTNQDRARAAMDEIEAVSNVQFVPRTNQSNYVRFVNSTGNSSYIGMIGGAQDINIFNWTWRFIIVHELLHALGDWHEQQRPDRDAYVQINWQNIQDGTSGNFSIRSNATAIGPYDFDSVMHYPRCAFSTCSCSASCYTITVLAPYTSWQTEIGQRDHLSSGDILFLTTIYGGGEVYNVTDDDFSSTIADAIGKASNGDLIQSTQNRFEVETSINFAGKAITLESYVDVIRPNGSTTSLANNSTLRAANGRSMSLSLGEWRFASRNRPTYDAGKKAGRPRPPRRV